MNRRNLVAIILIGITGLVVLGVVWKLTGNRRVTPGEQLARQYCASCHVFPEPDLLTKQVWSEFVLPQMAFRMGLPNLEIMGRMPADELAAVLESIPDSAMISAEQFKAIREYYLKLAPNQLQITETEFSELTQFKAERAPFQRPFLTMLESDTINKKLYIGTQNSWLFTLDPSFTVTDSIHLNSPPSFINRDGKSVFLSQIGILMPNDQARGAIVRIAEPFTDPQLVLDSLRRPVHFIPEDINDDGKKDFIVCNFGNHAGNLSLYISQQSGFARTILSNTPGARKVIVKDYNGDKKNDILALFAQGDERIVLYLNQGSGSFSEKIILRFPPVYGSNYFDLVDFNKDGFNDILMTNGDNGDYSMIQKPYHGVRIFLNDGAHQFKEHYFFPMPGASQAVANDFDHDGDLDIAAISFFPDFEKHPERAFVYLNNKGQGEFAPQYTKAGSLGRWLLMATWDYDHDGDTDILLGASSYRGLGANQEVFRQWRDNATGVLLLKNEFH
jgi:hypothetical protein